MLNLRNRQPVGWVRLCRSAARSVPDIGKRRRCRTLAALPELGYQSIMISAAAIAATEPAFNRAARTPWGSRTVAVRMAGLDLQFGGLSAHQGSVIRDQYRVADGSVMISGQTQVVQGAVPTMVPGRFSVDGIYTPTSTFSERGLEMEGLGFRSNIELGNPIRGTLTTDQEDLTVQPIVLQNYLRGIVAYLSLLRGGLLLHCAVVIVNDLAYLFLGRSGAGKTTLARTALAEGYEVLSDDAAVALPRADGGFEVGYVPFAGELGTTCTDQQTLYPVAGLGWLVKSRELRILPMSLATQMSRALACCPTVNADPYRVEQAMSNLEQLLGASPMDEIQLNKDISFSRVFDQSNWKGVGS